MIEWALVAVVCFIAPCIEIRTERDEARRAELLGKRWKGVLTHMEKVELWRMK